MSEGSSGSGGGIGFFSILTLIFITLKLTGHITWSWWWVLAPTWIPLALVLLIIFGCFAFAGVAAIVLGATTKD
jgi:hypothetical protein